MKKTSALIAIGSLSMITAGCYMLVGNAGAGLVAVGLLIWIDLSRGSGK